MMENTELIVLDHNVRTRFAIIDKSGNVTKTNDNKTIIPKNLSKDKFKKECHDIDPEYKDKILSSWQERTCGDYDFLLTFCALFTIHTFETLANRIFVQTKKKHQDRKYWNRTTRWGIGKRIYGLLR